VARHPSISWITLGAYRSPPRAGQGYGPYRRMSRRTPGSLVPAPQRTVVADYRLRGASFTVSAALEIGGESGRFPREPFPRRNATRIPPINEGNPETAWPSSNMFLFVDFETDPYCGSACLIRRIRLSSWGYVGKLGKHPRPAWTNAPSIGRIPTDENELHLSESFRPRALAGRQCS